MPDPIPSAQPPEVVAALLATGTQALDAGDYSAAHASFAQALTTSLALRGPDDLSTAQAQRGLGVALLQLGEYAAGRALLEQALATRERLLGPDHSETADALAELSSACFYQHDLAAASRLATHALAIRERTLGADHPDTIDSLNNLGAIVARQGQMPQAIALHTEALARCERALGEHRRTVEVLNALAVKLAQDVHSRGRARALYQRALAMSERVFGPQHPMTALLLNNLAAVQSDLGNPVAARLLLERSLALHEQLFGPEHPNTAWVLVNLGDLDRYAKDDATARERYTRALIIREAALGAQHPLTVHALRQLVAAFDTRMNADPAAVRLGIPLYQCLAALDAETAARDPLRAMGASMDKERAAARLHALVAQLAAELHRPTPTPSQEQGVSRATALEQQANAHLAAGLPDAARAALEEAIALREEAQGPAHLDLVAPLRALETAMARLGRPSAVLPLRERAVEIQVQALGAGHPLAINALTDLMGLVSFEYGVEAAAPVQERILDMLERSLGPDAPFTRQIRDQIERMRASGRPSEPPAHSRSEWREAALAELHPLATELLTNLEDIPWSQLHHAYGPADDVPGLLRMLLSDDGEVREGAFEQLYGAIWHQGTVYEASAYAVPFLLRMAADPRTPDRVGVVSLLSALATGSSYLAVHHREEDSLSNERARLAKQGKNFDRQLQLELDHVRAANAAVAAGADLLLTLAEDRDGDEQLRAEALAVIAVLPSRAGLTVPRLDTLLSVEDVPALRTAIARALHDLSGDDESTRQRFGELLAAEEPDAVRLIAAVGLLTCARAEAPERAVDVVLDALHTLGAYRHQFDAPEDEQTMWEAAARRLAPAWAPPPLEFSVGGLCALGIELACPALLRALRFQRDPEDAEHIAATLLNAAFPPSGPTHRGVSYTRDRQTGRPKIEYWGELPPPARQAGDLTEQQREVLTALLEHEPLWEYQSNLLELYGWPSERVRLRALLAESHYGEA